MRMNLSEAVRTWAVRQGNSLALSGSRQLTYIELDKLASFYADYILTYLSEFSEKIAIISDDNIAFVTYLIGIIRSGNVFVLINPNLSDEQINKSLKSINCNYYISDRQKINLDANYISLPRANEISKYCYSNKSYPHTGLTDDAGVIFSSGTTGEPKALLRNSFSILSEAIQWMIELQLQREMSFLVPRPLYYTGGFILMYASLFSGGRVDLLDDISIDNVLDYLNKTQCDWAFIVPSVIREMITYTGYVRMARNVLTMGSPIYHSDKKLFYEKFKCNLIEVWGNSEGLGTITEPSDIQCHPYSIGRPFFTDYLDVLNVNSANEEGLLFGMSDNEFTGYIGKQKLTAEVLHDGYIYSEDIGYKDKEGYFYLSGRTKDIIVIDGIKVFPTDLEMIVLHNKDVADCAIFNLPDSNGNDSVSLAIVMKNCHSVKKVIAEINSNLAPHEKIQNYMILNKIPRNHGGKVDKNAIVALFNKHLEGKNESSKLSNDS